MPAEAFPWGPFNRATPYVAIDAASGRLLRLDKGSARTVPVGGALTPAVLCDSGGFAIGYGLETTFRSFEDGATFTLSGTGDPVCLADQLGLLTDSGFQRLSVGGERLADVPIPGVILASGGDDGNALIVTSKEAASVANLWRSVTVLRIPASDPVTSRAVDLPEPGLVEGVWASGGRVHLSWRSDRAVWLSSLPVH